MFILIVASDREGDCLVSSWKSEASQEAVVSLVLSGHNVFFQGGGGGGAPVVARYVCGHADAAQLSGKEHSCR